MRCRKLAFLFLLNLAMVPTALAATKDYEFKAVRGDIKNGEGAELSVKLTDKRTGQPVSGAVIFRSVLDMSPDSMGEMKAKHQALPSEEAGIYRFKADITMAGKWAFKVQAKVPGEKETIEATVIFTAKD